MPICDLYIWALLYDLRSWGGGELSMISNVTQEEKGVENEQNYRCIILGRSILRFCKMPIFEINHFDNFLFLIIRYVEELHFLTPSGKEQWTENNPCW